MKPEEFKQKYSIEQRLSPTRRNDYLKANMVIYKHIEEIINSMENVDEEIKELLQQDMKKIFEKKIDKIKLELETEEYSNKRRYAESSLFIENPPVPKRPLTDIG